MKKRLVSLAGCIAASVSTNSIANVLPDNFVGLNLGEISSSSFLNQPFKGVIPFLFTSFEQSKNLKVRLAPEYIFNEIGVEKDPILNSLTFQITRQNNKPVVLIGSTQPIQLPFLNFVLEIVGPKGSIYQDYTVLLDPASKQATIPDVDYIDLSQTEIDKVAESSQNTKEVLSASGTLLLANLSSEILSTNTQSLQYKVRSGDSLSKIAQAQKTHNVSNKLMSNLIFQKNQKAFINGDVNRIKKGALLNLPSIAEINGFELVNNTRTKTKIEGLPAQKLSEVTTEYAKYTVVKGDSLSKIAKNFVSEEISFATMMNEIFQQNPKAFINHDRNKLKANAELIIPSFTQQYVGEKLMANNNAMLQLEPDSIANKSADNLSKTKSSESNQYRIKPGDTLSFITNKIGYKEVPFAKMLNAIYLQNPNSFIDGNMTKLVVGSVITLPAITAFELNPEPIAQVSNQTNEKRAVNLLTATNKNVPSTDLIRRIRELRKELKQSKQNLLKMKEYLNQKEILLQQKDIQLDALKITLTKLNDNVEPELVSKAADKVKALFSVNELATSIVPIKRPEKTNKDVYKPKSKAELAKLKRELLINQQKTNRQLEKMIRLKNKTLSENKLASDQVNKGLFKKYAQSDVVKFVQSNYSYLTMALLLTLLLIRYRRELYTYTYSAINYDQPTYYPIPAADKYELKETNISFHDAKMDEDARNNHQISIDDSEYQIPEKVVINPLLVEATEEIFAEVDEQQEIEDSEPLIAELFDDLTGNETAADLNHNLPNLFEGLDDVDNSSEKNDSSDGSFPSLGISMLKPEEVKKDTKV